MATGYYGARTSQYENQVTLNIDLTVDSGASSTTRYRSKVYFLTNKGAISNYDYLDFGTVSPGKSVTYTKLYSSMLYNTLYTFRGYLQDYWGGGYQESGEEAGWHTGSASFQVHRETGFGSPINARAQINGNNVEVSWTQVLGSEYRTTGNTVTIIGTSLSSSSISYGNKTTTVDGVYQSRSCSINISSLSQGNYRIKISNRDSEITVGPYYYSGGEQQEEGNGRWSNISLTQAANSTAINYTATWTSTWTSNISWQLSAYLDTDNNSGARLKIQTGTLSNGGSLTISGTTSNVSMGNHTIYFHADANGPDGGWTSKTIQISEGPPTPPETPAGNWKQDSSNPRVNNNQTVFYGRRFTQTSSGNVTWTLEAFFNSVDTSPINTKTLNGTGNGSKIDIYGNYDISSLSPGTYEIIWRATTSGISAIITRGSFTIESPIQLLKWSWQWENADWSWNKQKSQINHNRIQGYLDDAYTAISEQGPTTDFSYLIWNDLINWVIYNIDQLNLSYTPEQARAKGDAKMEDTVAGRTLTAYRYNNFKLLYNKLYKALGHQNNLYNNDVSSGDQVSGYNHFVYIVTNLNTSIDNYS